MAEREKKSHAKQGAMTPEEAGHLGGVAPHTHGMTREEAGHKGGSAPHTHGMTREEAGHLGGTAPHKCRGFQCQEEKSHSSQKSHKAEEE